MKEQSTNTELKLKASLLRDQWQTFCELHTELYEVTCDEYMHLLASEIDLLETDITNKNKVINKINEVDKSRTSLNDEIALLLNSPKPEKLAEMLSLLEDNDEKLIKKDIERLNLILLDIIEKIQAQNKKNQVFLNKAILSLRELKDSFTGKTNYNTYSPKGMTITSSKNF